MDFDKILDASLAVNKADGIDLRGKRYTTVAIRVDLFRRQFGDWGIETSIVQMGEQKGESVVVKCLISDPACRIIATGHAHEIIGQGSVNTTSALENAETSAIGRALAALGIHGGEFASVNEIDGAGRNKTAGDEAAERHDVAVEREIGKIGTIASLAELKGYWGGLPGANPAAYHDKRIIAAKDARKHELTADANQEGAA